MTFRLTFLLFLLFPHVFSKLLAFQLASRHGTRAPDKVVGKICPNELPNLQRYIETGISLSGMTGQGMQELYDLGIYTYQKYVNSGFLGPNYTQDEVYVRAVGSERTLQSAILWNTALFPPSTRPKAFLAEVPPPVPVYSTPDKQDDLIEIRKSACADRLAYDVATWDATEGPKYWYPSGIVDGLSEMCGQDLRKTEEIVGKGDAYSVGDAIKDITDAIVFDYLEGYPPLPHWSMERLQNYSQFAQWQIEQRLYRMPEQVTYMNGALPTTIIANFEKKIKGKTSIKAWSYHAHREMTYAMGKLFKIDWSFLMRTGIPRGAVPAGTSIFFELHEIGEKYYVTTDIWAPCIDNTTGKTIHSTKHHNGDPKHIDCPAHRYTLDGCPAYLCPFENFKNLVESRINATGSWDKLCLPQPSPLSAAAFKGVITPYDLPYWIVFFAVSLVIIGSFFIASRSKRHDYEEIRSE